MTETLGGWVPGPDRELESRYEPVRRLGQGGAGEVWLARHRSIGTLAAIKWSKGNSPGSARAIERERRAVARLSHPHVVSTYDLTASCLVMAYIDGPDIGQRIQRGAVSPRDALRWTLQVASALSHAHARGIIHGDVKPSNILVDARNNAFLADFGAARFLEDAAVNARRPGTPAFMPPEQRGDGPIAPSADQYALGRSLIDMLAGRHVPATEENPSEHVPSHLPVPLRATLRRAIEQDPAARWPSMDDFASALAEVAGELDRRRSVRPPPLRDASPFAWARQGRAIRVAPDILRGDCSLDSFAGDAPSVPRVRAFQEQSGQEQFTWSSFVSNAELEPRTTRTRSRARTWWWS